MNRLFKLAYTGIIIFLGLIFFTSGMAKLVDGHRFIGMIGPPWLEERLAEFGLGLFARFIGYAQVSIGYLLLTYRFRTLGSVMLVPMLLNILAVTVSQNWKGTPYVVSVLLLLNFYVLWYDRHTLLPLVLGGRNTGPAQPVRSLQGNLLWFSGYLMAIAAVWLSYISLPVSWALSAFSLLWGGACCKKEEISSLLSGLTRKKPLS